MVLYHTIRLTSLDATKTAVLDVETMKSQARDENILAVIDNFNKQGYYLTAVSHHDYYLTKRID